ncbi:MAG: AAA family ATPase [Bacteroidales bacterium]|nr:AAA family ATPase [Bacteroidales bacterium]
MAHLIIKNIGPLKDVELDLNRINVFLGPQSSGKSTISKILCHCQWVEKTCFMDSKELEYYQKPEVFYDSLVEYHKMEGFFNKNASIKYKGDYLTITYTHSSKRTIIKLKGGTSYSYPKISYIPSERNFVAGVSNFDKYNEGSNVILYFGYDWNDAKRAIKKLDISKLLNRNVLYENLKDEDYIFDNGSKIRLVNASSGVQSVLPLFQTILYMLSALYEKPRILSPSKENARKELTLFFQRMQFNIIKGNSISKDDKQDVNQLLTIFKSMAINGVKSIRNINDLSNEDLLNAFIDIDNLFEYHYTQLFIEEPEQNLFPDTQQEFIYWLLSNISNERQHAVVVTTHSPYILFALNNCMMGGLVKDNIPDDKRRDFPSYSSWIDPKSVSVFEICDGEIKCIQDKDGIIEDNYLNKAYKKNAEEYLSLLNYYDDEE